jgi:hypothetical protein
MGNKKVIIPPSKSGFHDGGQKGKYHHGLTSELRSMTVGEYITRPRSIAFAAHSCAKAIGMKVSCRGMGSKTHTRIYRIK